MRENLCQLFIWQRANIQKAWKTQKSNTKLINNSKQIKWTDTYWRKKCEWSMIILLNDILLNFSTSFTIWEVLIKLLCNSILLQSNGYSQEHKNKWILWTYRKKEFFFTVGENVNYYRLSGSQKQALSKSKIRAKTWSSRTYPWFTHTKVSIHVTAIPAHTGFFQHDSQWPNYGMSLGTYQWTNV